MKNFKLIITFLSLLLILQISNFSKFNDYIEFNPFGYTIERNITMGGTILETKIDIKVTHIIMDLKKHDETYKLQMLNFKNIVNLMDFWYTFVNNYSDKITSAISAIPFVHGEFNSMYKGYILKAWFNGFDKTFFIITGTDKAGVEDLSYRIINFKINGD
ncbi:hypothetical protein OSSY52_10710 [Tepiditoga spiralis]|uniref:Uncharacterized protein n=1 Tax=Tepiditoga spiralis TaxID=2108365 RepID=A0A7G1G3E8_9BACT|nr:hypothetical protein [Tepiditoga spiralis]BBE30930.1 hypothetical protein OSSY52_10710 [Tepiditoga spiralis]